MIKNYRFWANLEDTENYFFCVWYLQEKQHKYEWSVLWLTDLAENLVDDRPSWSLLASQRILKSAKKWPFYCFFSSKVTAPTLKGHCVFIFQDIAMLFETLVVQTMVIISTNRHPKRMIITEIVNVERLLAGKQPFLAFFDTFGPLDGLVNTSQTSPSTRSNFRDYLKTWSLR